MPSKKLIIPRFKSEAEEARWWDGHMGQVEELFLSAMKKGTLRRGMALKLVKEARKSKNITIRMPIDDIDKARTLAEKKGIGYQTYMKMLLHQALGRESRLPLHVVQTAKVHQPFRPSSLFITISYPPVP